MWDLCFDERDRVAVESLLRRGSKGDEGPALLASDDDLLVAVLLLVRSVRLDHVALSLHVEDLHRTWHEAVGDESAMDPRRLIGALFNRDHALVREWVDVVSLSDDVTAFGPPLVLALVDGAPRYLYLRRLAHAEDRLARSLWGAAANAINSIPLGPLLASDEGWRTKDAFAAPVIRNLRERRISVITGGPGTGKTTSVAHALGLLVDALLIRRGEITRPLTVALCAPTAKAAVRLQSAIRDHFQTRGNTFSDLADIFVLEETSGSVHRLLGIRPDRVVNDEQLDADIIVVDEVSMLELTLLDQLLHRVSPTTRVLLVGDPDQLASVHVGAALSDLVDASGDNGPLAPIVTRLTTNFRSDDAIAQFASAVNSGNLSDVLQQFDQHTEALTLTSNRRVVLEEARRRARAAYVYAESGDREVALSQLTTRVILCATRKGSGSTAWWDQQISPEIAHIDLTNERFALSTPVLVTRNEPNAGTARTDILANGDVGVVVRSGTSRVVVFATPQGTYERPIAAMPECEAAWAMTIHKSQGSEYDEVTVSLPDRDTPLLTRELIYTAVTRAKQHVTLICAPEQLERALSRRVDRVSGLAARLLARHGTDPSSIQ